MKTVPVQSLSSPCPVLYSVLILQVVFPVLFLEDFPYYASCMPTLWESYCENRSTGHADLVRDYSISIAPQVQRKGGPKEEEQEAHQEKEVRKEEWQEVEEESGMCKFQTL